MSTNKQTLIRTYRIGLQIDVAFDGDHATVEDVKTIRIDNIRNVFIIVKKKKK